MYYIDGKGHNLKLNSSRNDLTNHTKSKLHHWLLMASGVDTNTDTRRGTHEGYFRKPNISQPTASA